jgi:hypothetical protein
VLFIKWWIVPDDNCRPQKNGCLGRFRRGKRLFMDMVFRIDAPLPGRQVQVWHEIFVSKA